MNTALLQGYLFEKTIASFPQRKQYEVTNQQVKLLLAVSMLSQEMSVPTKKIYFLLKELNFSENYWYVKATLNKLVSIGLLMSTSVGQKGFYRYRMSVHGKLLLYDLEHHANKVLAAYVN